MISEGGFKKVDGKELITFKGMVDGVRINVDESAAIFDALNELEAKILESRSFFGDGNCHISFGGKRLSTADKERFCEFVKKMLPMCHVSFESDKPKDWPQTDWISAYKERNEKPVENFYEKAETPEPVKTELITALRSSRARLHHGDVNADVVVESDGHLVLVGNVLEGGAIAAVGNIIVIGGIYGTAHAGCNGHKGSYIMAMDMRPQGLAIAQTAEEYVYNEEIKETEDEIETKIGFFEKLKKRSEIEENNGENDEKKTFPAIALCKSNKIELNNFTFQDFTNLKNMV